MSDDGLVTLASKFSVTQTRDRLETDPESKGITVFARIDDATGAASVAMPPRPTELWVFGNPKPGTPLTQSNPTIGIDLPLHVLSWQDARGKVWLTCNDPSWPAPRHGLGPATNGSANALATGLANLAKTAARWSQTPRLT